MSNQVNVYYDEERKVWCAKPVAGDAGKRTHARSFKLSISQRRKKRIESFSKQAAHDQSFVTHLTSTGGDVLSKHSAKEGVMAGRHLRKSKYKSGTWIKNNPRK